MTHHTVSIGIAIIVIAVAPLIGGCDKSDPASTEVSPSIPVSCVVNEPLRYFTQRIAGDAVEIRFPAPAGEDPAFWKPSADAIALYQSADLILLNGATYAKWVPLAPLPASRLVDTSAAFSDALIHVESAPTHSHGPTGAHAHAGTAFTTWLDFQQAIAQARAIHEALARLRPEMEPGFRSNHAALESDLQALDARMAALAATIGDRPLIASHPVYQYWARRYGLNVRAVMWEPGIVADDRALGDLDQLLGEHPATLMIWEAEPDPRSVSWLEGRGLRSLVFDPCGATPAEGDFLATMNENLAGLAAMIMLEPR